MKIKFLFDQGSAVLPEDGIIFQPPFYYGVVDGVSGLYLPSEGPKMFDGKTGGQLASSVVSWIFTCAGKENSLSDILREATFLLQEHIERNGLSLFEPETLPSAAFAIAHINETHVSVINGADSLAVWQKEDGTVSGTPNQMFAYEGRQIDRVAELMKKHQGNRQRMWEEFRPLLVADRRANINKENGYAVINGQLQFKRAAQNFTLEKKKMKLLILFTDGFIPYEWTRDRRVMAFRMIKLYEKGGLSKILELSRKIAEKKKSSSHEDFPEATAIAIEF